MRRSFLEFCEYAVSKDESLKKMSLKSLTDLVFLFRTLSGYYNESAVLPNDDQVYNFIYIYDKCRDILTKEFRDRSLNCLWRYPNTHTAVPKNVFSKVTGFYSKETDDSKKNWMNIVLEMIHTDVMREKLFAFVKANYDEEDAETRSKISESLCRVYYGGFLQLPIIEFFTEHFENEPVQIREMILEKLLLTVRTPSVQAGVVGFITKYFPIFTDAEKKKFYFTFYEMLPDGDGLSRALADIVDANIDCEYEKEVKKHLISALQEDEKNGSAKVCKALSTKCGFTERTVAEKVFSDWQEKEIFREFIRTVSTKDIVSLAETLGEIWDAVPEMGENAENVLFEILRDGFGAKSRSSLFSVISAADISAKIANDVPSSKRFVERFDNELIYPLVSQLIPTAFDVKRYPNGVEELSALAAERPYITSSEQYSLINDYNSAVCAICNAKLGEALSFLEKNELAPVRLGEAELITRNFSKNDDPKIAITAIIAAEYLKSGELKFSDTANVLRDMLIKKSRESEPGADAAELAVRIDGNVLDEMLGIAAEISLSSASDELRSTLTNDSSDLVKYIKIYLNKYEKKGKKSLAAKIDTLNASESLISALRGISGAGKTNGGFFSRIFKIMSI